MSSDLIGRRRAVQERLERARTLELSLKQNTEMLAESTGMTIEQLDFDGSLRAALAAVASVASRRTQFDVIVTLPDAPFGVRIRHVNNSVSADVVAQREAPYEPIHPPAATGPAAAGPAAAQAYEPVPLHPAASQYEPAVNDYEPAVQYEADHYQPAPLQAVNEVYQAESYRAETYPAETYPAGTHHTETYPAETYPAETYEAQTYEAEGYQADGYAADSYQDDVHESDDDEPAAPAATQHETSDHVASDLAALLWQDVDDKP